MSKKKLTKKDYVERFLRRGWITKAYVAENIGVPRQIISDRLRNNRDFNKEEIDKLIEVAKQIKLDANEFLNAIDSDF